ncbi:MAG: hypothetical protein ACR2H0_01645 [Candidatus Limnocylindrales bacterium]
MTAKRRGERLMFLFGEEVRHARIALARSQASIAASARMSQSAVFLKERATGNPTTY